MLAATDLPGAAQAAAPAQSPASAATGAAGPAGPSWPSSARVGVIAGEVRSPVGAGQGLSGICVVLAPSLQGTGQVGVPLVYLSLVAGQAGVSSRGSYRVTAVPPGNYEVSFSGGCGSAKTLDHAAS